MPYRRARHIAAILKCCLVPLAFLFLTVAAHAAAIIDERRKLPRIYNYLELAESLEEYRDREFFEFIYRYAAIERTPQLQFMLGLLYHHGLGVEKNPAQAARWYKEAAKGGYDFKPYLGKEADKGLRLLMAAGLDLADSPPPAPALEEKAYAGGGHAMLRLAMQFEYGLCAPMDFEKAMEWEVRAAESGYPKAAAIVADRYRFGENAYPRDPHRAEIWHRGKGKELPPAFPPFVPDQRASPPPPTLIFAGQPYQADPHAYDHLAREWLRRADQEKQAKAASSAASGGEESPDQPVVEYAREIFADGLQSYTGRYLSPDYFLAGLHFSEATAFGLYDPLAYFLLGWLQENGLCGNPNFYGAGKNYRIAAELGHPDGMFRLALLHENGVGVRRSLEQARTWYAAAKAAGVEEAATGLAWLERQPLSDAREEWEDSPEFRRVLLDAQFREAFNYSPYQLPEEMRRATAWLLKAADNGHPYAQYLAGTIYQRGDAKRGCPANPAKARTLLEKAARAGVTKAER